MPTTVNVEAFAQDVQRAFLVHHFFAAREQVARRRRPIADRLAVVGSLLGLRRADEGNDRLRPQAKLLVVVRPLGVEEPVRFQQDGFDVFFKRLIRRRSWPFLVSGMLRGCGSSRWFIQLLDLAVEDTKERQPSFGNLLGVLYLCAPVLLVTLSQFDHFMERLIAAGPPRLYVPVDRLLFVTFSRFFSA